MKLLNYVPMFYQTALQTSKDQGSEHAPGTDNPESTLLIPWLLLAPRHNYVDGWAARARTPPRFSGGNPPFHWCFINLIPQHLRKAEERALEKHFKKGNILEVNSSVGRKLVLMSVSADLKCA